MDASLTGTALHVHEISVTPNSTLRPAAWNPRLISSAQFQADKALQKIIDAIWKAANNPNRSGDGSTMAAIADELATGQTTFGKLHRGAGMDQQRSLSNWLDQNPNAAADDRQIAAELVRRLLDALQGR